MTWKVKDGVEIFSFSFSKLNDTVKRGVMKRAASGRPGKNAVIDVDVDVDRQGWPNKKIEILNSEIIIFFQNFEFFEVLLAWTLVLGVLAKTNSKS